MIPFLFALTFFILLTMVFVIPGLILLKRWKEIIVTYEFDRGDMKVPTFYSIDNDGYDSVIIILIPVVGVIFGGIHCAGWFFDFPSSDEAMLWRVSSAVLTVSALLLPLNLVLLLWRFFADFQSDRFGAPVVTIILLLVAYVVSRLLLLVEAFISLRHLTPGMLALVRWTSFIPHI